MEKNGEKWRKMEKMKKNEEKWRKMEEKLWKIKKIMQIQNSNKMSENAK